MRKILLSAGEEIPCIGLGTWHMGESANDRAKENSAIRFAIELGYRAFDTAEMYGEGGAELLLGRAISEALRTNAVTRDQLFVVSKVYPHNANRAGILAACERSRRRLQLDHIDLYLLHWPSVHPLVETINGFEWLRSGGQIRHWGVSNFDIHDMQALLLSEGGERCAINQIYYSVATRGPEFELLPWQKAHSIPAMAYSPLDQGDLANQPHLQKIAERYATTGAQVALAWLMARQNVMVIPKSSDRLRLQENFEAVDLELDDNAMTMIDQHFPPPRRKIPLEMR